MQNANQTTIRTIVVINLDALASRDSLFGALATAERVALRAETDEAVALATHLPLSVVTRNADAIPHVRFVLSEGGSLTYDLATGEVVGRITFDSGEVSRVIMAARCEDVVLQAASSGATLMNEGDMGILASHGIGEHPLYAEASVLRLADFTEAITCPELGVEEVLIHHGDVCASLRTYARLISLPVGPVRREGALVVARPLGSNLGRALVELRERLGVEPQRTVLLGGDETDVFLRTVAGVIAVDGGDGWVYPYPMAS